VQFGVTVLIPVTFPNSYSLSPALDLFSIPDRIVVVQWINAIASFLVGQIRFFSEFGTLKKIDNLPRGKLARSGYFYKPIYTKLPYHSDFKDVKVLEVRVLFLLRYQMEIFRRLWESDCRGSICFPVGFVGFPNAATSKQQKLFTDFIARKVMASCKAFESIPYQNTGHPILIFPNIKSDAVKWKTISENDFGRDNLDEVVITNAELFIRDLTAVFAKVYEAGVVHLDIRMDNIFYYSTE
jgi:hypothetical protein